MYVTFILSQNPLVILISTCTKFTENFNFSSCFNFQLKFKCNNLFQSCCTHCTNQPKNFFLNLYHKFSPSVFFSDLLLLSKQKPINLCVGSLFRLTNNHKLPLMIVDRTYTAAKFNPRKSSYVSWGTYKRRVALLNICKKHSPSR